MKKIALSIVTGLLVTHSLAFANEKGEHASASEVINKQNKALLESSLNKGFGPQSPRDIGNKAGTNPDLFGKAPPYQYMNLCNIHFHKNAEHKGAEFSKFAGAGDGHGSDTGYLYSGKLSKNEATPLESPVCTSEHGSLNAGDTIELHYVHSTASVKPGSTLAACLQENDANPQLRVESLVVVLVNDKNAQDFGALTKTGPKGNYQQALNIPKNKGKAVEYSGSTTGPAFNEKASPIRVTWNVRPQVVKVNANSVGEWCKSNEFGEDHAHGARNLVTAPELLSRIK